MLAAVIILLLILVGIGGIILTDNLIKKVMSLSILNSALVILFVWGGSLSGSEAPILLVGVRDIVDPLPQAVMLTAIVIGICVTAVALAIVLRIYKHWGTVSRQRIEELAKNSDD
ncbi:MAG: NADH-quinone oxidoreductase subunit K [Spirochaetaceae bacterium]|nr:MAG: NADH-quinone oxidoreductase subunit K [Spirochaetaceae bacterium]